MRGNNFLVGYWLYTNILNETLPMFSSASGISANFVFAMKGVQIAYLTLYHIVCYKLL